MSPESLGRGSSIEATIGNIPHAAPNDADWLNDERYDWRMFMCKAQLGPFGMQTEVLLQGYVVDSYGEDASGGLDGSPTSRSRPP